MALWNFFKGFITGASMDAAISGLFSISKQALMPIVRFFLEKAGTVATDELVDKIASMLPTTERDEQVIDDAFILIENDPISPDPNIRVAWNDLIELIDGLHTDPEEIEKMKEYYRRFTVKESVEKTALKIRTDANTPPDVFLQYLKSLSIERKALEAKYYQPFLDYAATTGKGMVDRIAAQDKKVHTYFEKGAAAQKKANDETRKKIAEKKKRWI